MEMKKTLASAVKALSAWAWWTASAWVPKTRSGAIETATNSSPIRGRTKEIATGWSTATSATSRPTGARATSTRNADDMKRAARENETPLTNRWCGAWIR